MLTNGLVYRFFSDLDEPNRMDDKPFLEFDLASPTDATLAELKKLAKAQFNQEAIIEVAGELKYTREMKRVVVRQLDEPDEDFVRLLT